MMLLPRPGPQTRRWWLISRACPAKRPYRADLRRGRTVRWSPAGSPTSRSQRGCIC